MGFRVLICTISIIVYDFNSIINHFIDSLAIMEN